MSSGTTSDQFFRDNLDWLARATNWAKFTAAASLGVIHKVRTSESLEIDQSHLCLGSRERGIEFDECLLT